MSIYELRDINYVQPNRMFSIRGDIRVIEKELKYTKVTINVLNYNDIDGRKDQFVVHFKGPVKKLADLMMEAHNGVVIMGDIIFKTEKIFFDGKIFEVYKTNDLVMGKMVKPVGPGETNYKSAF